MKETEYGPLIVDVEASIAVIGEESAEIRFLGKLPDRVRLSSSDADYPAGAELHRQASEILFSDPAADTVRSFQNHYVLHAVLDQNFRRR